MTTANESLMAPAEEAGSAVPFNIEAGIEGVRSWIKAYLQQHHDESGEPITDQMSFDYIGLDSMARVNLMTALESHFALKLDPTAAYDFVTVGSLSQFVWSQISGEPMDAKAALDI